MRLAGGIDLARGLIYRQAGRPTTVLYYGSDFRSPLLEGPPRL